MSRGLLEHCVECDGLTGRCGEDSTICEICEAGPLCDECSDGHAFIHNSELLLQTRKGVIDVVKVIWERVYDETGFTGGLFRAKVPGGWLVRVTEDVLHVNWPERGALEYGRDWRTSVCFVPDPHHMWGILEEALEDKGTPEPEAEEKRTEPPTEQPKEQEDKPPAYRIDGFTKQYVDQMHDCMLAIHGHLTFGVPQTFSDHPSGVRCLLDKGLIALSGDKLVITKKLYDADERFRQALHEKVEP